MSTERSSMARYFFHIRDGGRLIEDEEGVDVPEMPDTAAQLTKAALEVISEDEWIAERTAGGEQLSVRTESYIANR